MRLGIADHFGWAIAVTASPEHHVVDRRRIALVEPGVTEAPIHYESGHLNEAETAALVAKVRTSITRTASAALEHLEADIGAPVVSISLRAWPPDFPEDIATLRRAPYESRADAIMYRQVLAEVAQSRGWNVHLYSAKDVVSQAAALLGERTAEFLDTPRDRLGPPWTKDHRIALAAAITAG